MFRVNDDLSIYVTRGDIASITLTAANDGEGYTFPAGSVVRLKVSERKGCDCVVLQKDFPVEVDSQSVEITLTEKDTRIGGLISKPKDYWYEIELNPFDNPQTIIGYDEDGAKVFKLFPEGKDLEGEVVPEDIPVVDAALDMTSTRPIENQAVARKFAVVDSNISKNAENIKNNADAIKAHTDNKENPHGVTKNQLGLGNVPNVATNDQTPTYEQAETLQELANGEKLSAAFGKIAKAVKDFIAHLGNKANPHGVTAAQAKARPDDWLPTIAEIGAAPSNPVKQQFIGGIGWFRVGEIHAYNCFRLAVNTIYDNNADNGALVDIVATYARPVLSKISTKSNGGLSMVVDQVRLVKSSSTNWLYYVEIHYAYTTSNTVSILISGGPDRFKTYETFTQITDDNIGGEVTATIALGT